MKPSLEAILRLLNRIEANHIALLCHHNADPDSYCSAYALSRLLALAAGIKSEIISEGGMSKLSRILMQKLRLKAPKQRWNPAGFDAFLLVDAGDLHNTTNKPELLLAHGRPLIIVDHHPPHPRTLRSVHLSCIDDKATSVGEMVAQMYFDSGTPISARVRRALLASIIYDTRHLLDASGSTLRVVAWLTDGSSHYSKVVSLMHVPMDESEKLARLKAAQRAQIRRVEGFLLAHTYVGSYEASVARSLLALGADVAIVASDKGGHMRVVGRATKGFLKKTGIHLGRDIMRVIGEEAGGTGGGHATAAAAKGSMSLEECMNLVNSLFSSHLAEVSRRKAP